mmetsp:Transcript_135470/g.433272  ORF Transcript_135470/g.433272 Transcript_135470/m.433272 type:complete len:265 (-) Transcript_135470:87-881(-)
MLGVQGAGTRWQFGQNGGRGRPGVALHGLTIIGQELTENGRAVSGGVVVWNCVPQSTRVDQHVARFSGDSPVLLDCERHVFLLVRRTPPSLAARDNDSGAIPQGEIIEHPQDLASDRCMLWRIRTRQEGGMTAPIWVVDMQSLRQRMFADERAGFGMFAKRAAQNSMSMVRTTLGALPTDRLDDPLERAAVQHGRKRRRARHQMEGPGKLLAIGEAPAEEHGPTSLNDIPSLCRALLRQQASDNDVTLPSHQLSGHVAQTSFQV